MKYLTLAYKELGDLDRLYISLLPGYISSILRYGIEFNQELLNDVKTVIETHFWGGVEPDCPPEFLDWWYNLSVEDFKFDPELTFVKEPPNFRI